MGLKIAREAQNFCLLELWNGLSTHSFSAQVWSTVPSLIWYSFKSNLGPCSLRITSLVSLSFSKQWCLKQMKSLNADGSVVAHRRVRAALARDILVTEARPVGGPAGVCVVSD